jgi:hypothetical protein
VIVWKSFVIVWKSFAIEKKIPGFSIDKPFLYFARA